MKRRLQNTTSKLIPLAGIVVVLLIWQVVSMSGLLPKFMLPSPSDVIKAFVKDLPLLAEHAKATLTEAFFGIFVGVTLAFAAAVLMDRFPYVYKAMYPLVVLTQTIPTIAIAPLLVLWLGYEMAPKITLIVITTFFPITVGLLDGFRSVDTDAIDLFKAMGASRVQIFRYMKLPGSLSHFFAGLRISAAYAIVTAVISEWLGGYYGLGVYMVRVKKSYSFDKMFAVIFLISAISLILMWLVDLLQKAVMPWERIAKREEKAQKQKSGRNKESAKAGKRSA